MSAGQQQYIVTPWKFKSELIHTRDCLFDDSSETSSKRAEAIARIHAWKQRGNLPHAVESTALLMEAQLFHHTIAAAPSQGSGHHCDSFPVRATYTMALTRFVTGFADLGRHKSGPGQSMLEVARAIDLPASFVEFRHEAVHEDMPSLPRLEALTAAAIDWLRVAYWEQIAAPPLSQEGPEVHAASLSRELSLRSARREQQKEQSNVEHQRQMRLTLKDFRDKQKVNLRGGTQMQPDVLEETVAKLLDSCASISHGNTLMVKLLCTPGMLLPNDNVGLRLEEHMRTSYAIWDDLLKQLACRSQRLMHPLISRMVKSIARQERAPASRQWIHHLFFDSTWREVFGRRYCALHVFLMTKMLLFPTSSCGDLYAASLQVLQDEEWADTERWLRIGMETFPDQVGNPAETGHSHELNPTVSETVSRTQSKARPKRGRK